MCPLEKNGSTKGGFTELQQEGAKEVVRASYGVTDMRGQMYRAKRLMPEAEVRSSSYSSLAALLGFSIT